MCRLTTFLLIIAPSIILSQPCFPEGIQISDQTDVDSFQTNYPNCSQITGDLIIGNWWGSNITNLNGLIVITSVGGDLELRHNNILPNLLGLNNIDSVGGDLFIGGINWGNDLLVDLTGLNNLTYINEDVFIIGNEN